MITPAVTVTNGKVVINCAWWEIEQSNVRILQADLKTKYALVDCLSNDMVMVASGKYSLDLDNAAEQDYALVQFDPPFPEGWFIIAECCRYTLTVVAWGSDKSDKRGDLAWSRLD